MYNIIPRVTGEDNPTSNIITGHINSILFVSRVPENDEISNGADQKIDTGAGKKSKIKRFEEDETEHIHHIKQVKVKRENPSGKNSQTLNLKLSSHLEECHSKEWRLMACIVKLNVLKSLEPEITSGNRVVFCIIYSVFTRVLF